MKCITRRTICFIIMIIVSFVVLLSTIYIANEYGHNCDEGECPICIMIEQCENTLKQIKYGMVAGFRVIIPLIIIVIQIIYSFIFVTGDTLVTNKIRMNN